MHGQKTIRPNEASIGRRGQPGADSTALRAGRERPASRIPHRPEPPAGPARPAPSGTATLITEQRGFVAALVCLFLFGMNLAHRSHCNLANQRRRGWMHEVSYGDAGNYWGLAGLVLSICKQNPALLPGFHLFITVSLCWHMRTKSRIVSKAAGKLMVGD